MCSTSMGDSWPPAFCTTSLPGRSRDLRRREFRLQPWVLVAGRNAGICNQRRLRADEQVDAELVRELEHEVQVLAHIRRRYARWCCFEHFLPARSEVVP